MEDGEEEPFFDIGNGPRFTVIRWKAVVLESIDYSHCCGILCPICKNSYTNCCIQCECQETNDECTIEYGSCGHSFHQHCLQRFLSKNNVCPLDFTEWIPIAFQPQQKCEISRKISKCLNCGRNFFLQGNWNNSCKHHIGIPQRIGINLMWSCCMIEFTNKKDIGINGCHSSKHCEYILPLWTTAIHCKYPTFFKRMVFTLMCIWNRGIREKLNAIEVQFDHSKAKNDAIDGNWGNIPLDVLFLIIRDLAVMEILQWKHLMSKYSDENLPFKFGMSASSCR